MLMQPNMAYATTIRSATTSWADCQNVTQQGTLTVTTNTPPTTQSTFAKTNWPASYPSATSSIRCELEQFVDHKDTMNDTSQGWSCVGTSTTRNSSTTWTFCSGHSINYGDTIQPKTDTRYFGSYTGYETKTASISSYIAN
jgi:hypothetical protein